MDHGNLWDDSRWNWFYIITADDDNDGDGKYNGTWIHSGYTEMNWIYNLKILNSYDDDMYIWEFVWDRIGGRWGREGIFGEKAAPDGVATERIFVYGE